MKWFVDDAQIRLQGGAFNFKLHIDDEVATTIPNLSAGRFAVPWKNRRVELIRIPVGRSVETELWVDGTRVPQGERGPRRAEAVSCPEHGKRTKRRCAVCDEALCRRCASVDGARCRGCFEDATDKEQEGRKKGWLIGAGVMLLIAVGLFVSGNADMARFGGAAIFGAGYMVYVAFFRKRPTPEALPGATTPTFEPSEDREPLVGRICGACDDRIARDRDAAFCDACRQALHDGCFENHRCRAPKTGPDWGALEAG